MNPSFANRRGIEPVASFVVRMIVFFVLLMTVALTSFAQDANSGRKVTRRVPPVYPEIARQARLTGTVRLVAVVAPNGSVKVTQPVGGNPVLLRSASDAVMQWKFTAAPQETKESVEINFAPN
jgi:TonB family protein